MIMLNSKKLYFYNVVMLFVPETSCFRLKRFLLRWCGVRIGRNVRVCSSARFYGNGELEIGDETWVGSGVVLFAAGLIRIGQCVDLAPQVYLGTGTHMIDADDGARSAGAGINCSILIEDGVWLGARVLVLPGGVVKRKSVVGAGAVVVGSLPVRSVSVGVPARMTRLF